MKLSNSINTHEVSTERSQSYLSIYNPDRQCSCLKASKAWFFNAIFSADQAKLARFNKFVQAFSDHSYQYLEILL